MLVEKNNIGYLRAVGTKLNIMLPWFYPCLFSVCKCITILR